MSRRPSVPRLPRSSAALTLALALAAALAAPARGASLLSTDTLTDPPALALSGGGDTWTGVFECFRADSLGACLQSRAVRAIEDLLPDDDEADPESGAVADGDGDLRLADGERLPKGMSPAVGRLIDRIGDMIASSLSQWIPEETDVEEAKSANDIEVEDQARGHHKKKKVHKAVKKMVIKLLILLYVKQQAIKLFLYSVQTFVFFKIMIFFGIWVATQVAKAFTLLSWHHHEKLSNPKVLYIEPQIKHVTEHHGHLDVPSPFEHVHHDEYDHHGYEYEPGHDVDSLWPRNDNAQQIAYKKQIPAAYRQPARPDGRQRSAR